MFVRPLALILMLSLSAAADLNRAQNLIDQHRGGEAILWHHSHPRES